MRKHKRKLRNDKSFKNKTILFRYKKIIRAENSTAILDKLRIFKQ